MFMNRPCVSGVHARPEDKLIFETLKQHTVRIVTPMAEKALRSQSNPEQSEVETGREISRLANEFAQLFWGLLLTGWCNHDNHNEKGVIIRSALLCPAVALDDFCITESELDAIFCETLRAMVAHIPKDTLVIALPFGLVIKRIDIDHILRKRN